MVHASLHIFAGKGSLQTQALGKTLEMCYKKTDWVKKSLDGATLQNPVVDTLRNSPRNSSFTSVAVHAI
jgi:hypothetical protein